MKITSLEVVGFGVWSHRTFESFSGGLNVFYGPNEAGKTTLMEFIRGLLYGFNGERRAYLPPVSGGPAGGRLGILVPNGACAIERFQSWESTVARARGSTSDYAVRTRVVPETTDITRTRFFRNDQGTGEAVEIRFGPERFEFTAPDGRRQGETEFRSLLNHVDERIFRRVFCVGIDELRELETLHESEVAAMLYQISVGTDRISLFDVLRQLRESRRALLDPGDGQGEIATLFGHRERLRSEIIEAGAPSRRFPELLSGRERLDREIAALESDLAHYREEERRHEAALSVRERWRKRSAIDQRIRNFPKIEELPFDAPDRISRYDSAIGERRRVLEEIGRQRSKLRTELAAMKLHASLQRNASKIEALVEQEPWIVSLAAQISELRTGIHELETQLDQERKRFGLEPRVFNALRRTSLAALQRPAEQLAQSRLTLDRFEAEDLVSDGDIAELRRQLETSLAPLGVAGLDEAIGQVGDRITLLRRRLQLEETLRQTTEQADRASQRATESRERQMLPLRTLSILGTVFVVGAVLIFLCILSIRYGSSPAGSFGVLSGLLGLGLIAGAMIGKTSLERTHRGAAEKFQEQADQLQRECEALRQECDELDQELPSRRTPWAEQLETSEAELTELETLIPLNTRILEAESERRASLAERNSAQIELDAARQRWLRAVESAGLPAGTTPRTVRELLEACERIDEMRLRLERARSEYGERTREQRMLHTRIAALVTQIDPELEHEEPVEIVRTLAARLREQSGERDQRRQVVFQLRRLRRQKSHGDSALMRLRRKRRTFLDQLGVRDAEELQLRIADQIELEDLQKQRTMVQREIEAGLAGRFREEDIATLLEPTENADRLDAEHDRIRKKIREAE
ncbi:MAG: AAA family ATPase, partial [Planctomycetia bacterium]|nr:AAA family ATPase [Planctomycetia bacterium]